MSSKDNSNKKPKKRRRNPFRFVLFDLLKWSRALSVLLWLRPKKMYESKAAKKPIRGGAVLVSNHTNIFDPIIMLCAFWYRHVHTIAMKELFNKKFPRWFFRNMLCIPVDRQNFNMNTYRAAVDVLLDKKPLCIFPEGGINLDETSINAFKSGAVFMALKGNAPIVPVYIAPRKKWYSRAIIVVGEPIDLNALCGGKMDLRKIDEVANTLREKEMKLMEVYNTWKTKKSSK